MKKSETIRKLYDEEENDLIALGIGKTLIREERIERFEDNWLPKIKEVLGTEIKYDEQFHKYTFKMQTLGTVDFYPKANKMLIRNQNKWKKPALKYIIKLLFGEKR